MLAQDEQRGRIGGHGAVPHRLHYFLDALEISPNRRETASRKLFELRR